MGNWGEQAKQALASLNNFRGLPLVSDASPWDD